jgi:hypothetical protein
MSKKVFVTNDDNDQISISSKNSTNTVIITKPETKVVTVSAVGPRGPRGFLGGTLFGQTGSFYTTTNNLKVTGSLYATEFFGDGNGLYNIPTSSIINFNSEVSKSMFPYIGKAEITGSVQILRPNIISGLDFFIIRSGSFNAVTVTSNGVLKLGEFIKLPTPVVGGIAYSKSNFWIGIE